MVTRSTNRGWTPIFGLLGGLVMESGGQLSHGAVVAREYGLPAVAGIAGESRARGEAFQIHAVADHPRTAIAIRAHNIGRGQSKER
jgi:phosphohistidine swiveling domain-containing protein